MSDAAVMLVCGLRGAAAIGALLALVGVGSRVVQLGAAALIGAWSAVIARPRLPADALWFVAGREVAIGAALGVAAAVPLVAVMAAGRLVDRASGRAFTEARGSAGGGPYGRLFGVLAAAVFVGIDGHVAIVAAIARSYVDAPVVAAVPPPLMTALGQLVPAAVRLAIPWLVTAAVVELAAGVAVRIAGRAAAHAPIPAAVPAALAMMTASLVGTLAVAIAALVR